MTRYLPSRHYLHAGIAAVAFSAFSIWCGLSWRPAYVPAGLFLLSAALLFFLGSRPPIEVHESHLAIGKRAIPWADIRRVDRTGWVSPLVLRIGLTDGTRISVIYPGDMDSSHSLLRHIRRCAREALIDGIPYRQFWGELLSNEAPAKGAPTPPSHHLLRPEDEAEVERLYLRLKTVGHLDPRNSNEEQ
jgi:hypothetical protein